MGSVRMDEGAKAAAARVATSSRRSLWWWRIRPPFLQLNVCVTLKKLWLATTTGNREPRSLVSNNSDDAIATLLSRAS